MSNRTPVQLDLVANMTSLTVDDSSRTVTDGDHTSNIATTMTDIAPIDSVSNDAVDTARCSSRTELSASSMNAQANTISDSPESLSDTPADNMCGAQHSSVNTPQAMLDEATNDRKSVASPFDIHSINHAAGGDNTSDKPDAEAASTVVHSTEPVPTIYPPRRPNIFRARQKHLRFPPSMYSRGPVGPDTVDATTQELEAADGFAVTDLQEFQAEIRERMKKKTEIFVNMVRQNVWQGWRVEDLGEVFEIED